MVEQIGVLVPRGAARQRALAVLGSSWTLGLVTAVLTWKVGFASPGVGLDVSWWAGLYMAAHRGMHFGSQFIFTYGPLGFLGLPWLWYGNLAVIAFVYQGILHIALCVSLVWALRRTLHAAVALLAVFVVVVISTPALDVPTALAAIWCLAALSPSPPRFARWIVLFGGAALGATQALIYLRSGPVILGMCAITLLAQKHWRRDLPLFIGIAALSFAALWFAAGQTVGNFPSFVRNSQQIVTGYSEAMGTPASSPVYLIGELLLGAVLIAAAAFTSATGRRRGAAAAVIALAAFSLFKEAAVRADPQHAIVFFTTAAGLVAAMAFGRRREIAVAALVGISVIAYGADHHARVTVSLNPITYVNNTSDQVRLLFSPARRGLMRFQGTIAMVLDYRLSPATQNLLKGHTVHIDPWEAAVAWAYGLNWDPLPVIQDYSAYTIKLDRLDAERLRSADAPQRILRENTRLLDRNYPTPTIDNRFATWDPPEKSLAMLCNYVTLQTTARWQVLGKVPDRCGPPRLIGSIETRYGAAVFIPSAPAGGIVYAKIYGAGVSSLERIRTLLYRARFRYVVVNGGHAYRLVPGTASDGLLMNVAAGVDYPAPFALDPAAHTIELTGSSGALRIDLYSVHVRVSRPQPVGRVHRASEARRGQPSETTSGARPQTTART